MSKSFRYFTRSKGVGRGFHKFQDPTGERHRLARFGQATGRRGYQPAPVRAPMGQVEMPVRVPARLITEEVEPMPTPVVERVRAEEAEERLPREDEEFATPGVRPYSNVLSGNTESIRYTAVKRK
jgi:hypothetical protein